MVNVTIYGIHTDPSWVWFSNEPIQWAVEQFRSGAPGLHLCGHRVRHAATVTGNEVPLDPQPRECDVFFPRETSGFFNILQSSSIMRLFWCIQQSCGDFMCLAFSSFEKRHSIISLAAAVGWSTAFSTPILILATSSSPARCERSCAAARGWYLLFLKWDSLLSKKVPGIRISWDTLWKNIVNMQWNYFFGILT